uniref:Uncharacterized protein n=1 Tax=Arundo donax TaxID=35708 RepID=A0A0A9CBW3_ARUDO
MRISCVLRSASACLGVQVSQSLRCTASIFARLHNTCSCDFRHIIL